MINNYNIKKMTFEDRFARNYYSKRASRNYIKYAKRQNRRALRREIKKELTKCEI